MPDAHPISSCPHDAGQCVGVCACPACGECQADALAIDEAGAGDVDCLTCGEHYTLAVPSPWGGRQL